MFSNHNAVLPLQALEIMEDSNGSIFITGRAGAGKATLLSYFRHVTKKKVAVLVNRHQVPVAVG